MKYEKTVSFVDISRFMKRWYVIAGRTTFLENSAHNSSEKYTWDEDKHRINVDFSFNQGSFRGKKRSLPQTAWIENENTNAHWKVQPFWPLKFDYLVLALDPEYQWTAIGVPSGRYLWIMSSEPSLSKQKLAEIELQLFQSGYPTHDIKPVPQQKKIKSKTPGEKTLNAKKPTPKSDLPQHP